MVFIRCVPPSTSPFSSLMSGPRCTSCGMDACEHEYPSMSRHNRFVPTGFYYQFARDASAFADLYAHGRMVSVLEGGYSDRALASASMSHFCGLVDVAPGRAVNKDKWSVESLVEVRFVSPSPAQGKG